MKAKTLRDILYKDKHCRIETIIDVDEKDVEKLVRIGAIQCLEAIPEPKVEINVIKNPIKVEVDKSVWDFNKETKVITETNITKEQIVKKPKRKYNKRSKSFGKRRF